MKIDKIPGNEGAKSRVQRVSLEMRVQEMSRENIFFIKLIIADFEALFELYLEIICSLCINTLQIVHECIKIGPFQVSSTVLFHV